MRSDYYKNTHDPLREGFFYEMYGENMVEEKKVSMERFQKYACKLFIYRQLGDYEAAVRLMNKYPRIADEYDQIHTMVISKIAYDRCFRDGNGNGK